MLDDSLQNLAAEFENDFQNELHHPKTGPKRIIHKNRVNERN